LPGLAVDSEDNLYVNWDAANNFVVAAKLNSSGSFLKVEVDPNESTSAVTVDLSTNDLYVDNVGSIGVYSPQGSLLERFGSGNLKSGNGIAVDSATGMVYVADSTTDTVDIFELEPYSPPVLEDESVSNIASTSATFDAQVNARGSNTEYWVEYGTTAAYGASAPVPAGLIAAGFGGSDVEVHRADLLTGTSYHYRVVARNELGTVYGVDDTFTTQTAGEELTLPDGRAWELVSPADKKGALIELFTSGGQTQAASDGHAITYLSQGPSIGENPEGKFTFTQNLSARGVDGWGSQDLTLPMGLPEEGAKASGNITDFALEYDLFSPNLSLGVAEPQALGTLPLAPGATERTLYLREDLTNSFLPLVTPADVPAATQFGGGEVPEEQMHFLAATPDFSHVIFESPLALTPEATREGERWNLYEWDAGKLQLIDVLPDDKLPTDAGELGGALLGGEGGPYGFNPTGGVARAVSDDGRRVAWTWGSPWREYRGLYVRDTVEEKTVQVGGLGAVLQDMNSDGSRVFYLEKGDLYMFSYSTDTSTDLTSARGAGELNAGVREDIMGSSEDGSSVYFVATGDLANGAVSGEDNLYVTKEEDGAWVTKFIGALSSEDENSWYEPANTTNPALDLPLVSSRVSPDGRYMAFMSDRPLTGYDNTDANSGQPDQEVYLYDAVAGKLVCASCDPTGARPVGVLDIGAGSQGKETTVGNLLVDRRGEWSQDAGLRNQWLAGNIPGWDEKNASVGTYQPRYLSDSGRLFFNSPDALVPSDTNGLEDVYEHEPAGVGDCTSASSTFSARSGGCVNLISSGTSKDESEFFDASENGDDVFFLTSSRLTAEDYDTSFDLYDAHVCSATVPCVSSPVSPPPCTSGDSCKVAPSPQPEIFGPAPSATFSGIGNVVEEPKKGVVKHKAKAKPKKKHAKHKRKKRNGKKAKKSGKGGASGKGKG
jgi:hypothetical protein